MNKLVWNNKSIKNRLIILYKKNALGLLKVLVLLRQEGWRQDITLKVEAIHELKVWVVLLILQNANTSSLRMAKKTKFFQKPKRIPYFMMLIRRFYVFITLFILRNVRNYVLFQIKVKYKVIINECGFLKFIFPKLLHIL